MNRTWIPKRNVLKKIGKDDLMDLQTLAQEVAEKIRKEMGERYVISVTTNLKNNDIEQIGITFTLEHEYTSPTIYINDLLEQMSRKEREPEDVVREVLNRYESSMASIADMKPMALELSTCKNRVVYRLISRERNQKALEVFPYIPFLDMAITFHIVIGVTPAYIQSIKIDRKLQEKWGVSVEQLLKMANYNTEKIFPLEIGDLNEIVKRHLQIRGNGNTKSGGPDMIVLTNATGMFGASVILYEEVMQNIADEIDCDLFVIPSSVHEMILVPVENEEMYFVFCELVKKINENFVNRDEVLSDKVYIYRRDENKFVTLQRSM